MPHANARLTVHGRLLLVQRVVHDRRPVAHVAKEMGLSRQAAHHWVGRYRAEGEAGLQERSSRPHRCPCRTSSQVEDAVVALRQGERRGQDWLGPALGVPARTVSRILRRHQLPYLRELDPLTGQQIRSSKASAIRYERERPGELAHMDVKKIGRIPDGGGWKAHGRGAACLSRDHTRRVGFDYVHSLIDDHSRLAYSEVLPDEKGATCAAFLVRAAAYFAAQGIPRIERVMTDNAWAYRWSLREVCCELGIKQIFIKPHCPWQNGKVERLNRTLATEWAYRRLYASNTERAAALAPWLEHYNTRRRHSALNGHPPVSRLSPT